MILLPWIVITAALSGTYVDVGMPPESVPRRLLAGMPAAALPSRGVWCCSRKAMHRLESRTARARSSGDGMPPWRVWPSEAERESKSSAPSSLRMLVMSSVV